MSTYAEFMPQLIKMLENLDGWLVEAEAHTTAQGLDPAALVQARLAPDMFPLGRQVMSACDTPKLAAARLSGMEAPVHADTEATLPELRERIASTLAYLRLFTEVHFEAASEVVLSPGFLRGGSITGVDYLREFVLPNTYFHLAMAYGILRHNGVPLGKRAWLGAMNVRMPTPE